MAEKEEMIANINREYGNLEGEWNSLIAHNIKMKMIDALDFIKKVYPDITSIDKIIQKYYEDNFITDDFEGLSFGYTYGLDELQEHLKKPHDIWKFYDASDDKSSFFKQPFIRYTKNKIKNHEMFSRDIIYGFISNFRLSEMQLNIMPIENRQKAFYEFHKGFKEDCVSRWEKLHKESYIRAIKKNVTILERLGVLEVERKRHNENMKKVGLEVLKLEEQVPAIDENGYVFGNNLENCSVLQLEALLSFYANRLEKHRENLGIGLFMLKEFEGLKAKDISNEQLKTAWKKYRILEFMMGSLDKSMHEEWVKNEGDEIQSYSFFVREEDFYTKAYENLFNAQNGRNDINLYTMLNGANKQNQYLIKRRLIEDIILQSYRSNANWGIMDEKSGSIKIGKMIYIGVDIPGFNMPLRLHYPMDNLKELMKEYIGSEEVPLYVGADDFVQNGNNLGTQLLLPITPKQSAAVKKLAKRKDDKRSELSKLVKHIACVQLPNMVKKLLDEKTGKTQQYPDYINIFTRRVRKTQRRGGTAPEDSDFSH